MHTTLLAYSFYLQPTSSDGERSTRRVYLATFFFALGAVFAWPFALLLAVPFVAEELFIGGKDVLSSNADEKMSWRVGRFKRLLGAAAASGLLFVSFASL
jgi:alpha-1,2-mannosyltransferase